MTASADFKIPEHSDGPPALTVLLAVLRWLRAHAEEWKAEASVELNAARRVRADLEAALDGLSLSTPLPVITDAIDDIVGEASRPTAARGVALALDTLIGRRMPSAIRDHYSSRFDPAKRMDAAAASRRVRLRRRDPVPDTRSTWGSMPADREPDRVDRVILAPNSLGGFRVWLDFTLSDVTLDTSSRIVTGHPVAGIGDYSEDTPVSGEFRDREAVHRRTLAMFDQAAALGASLFVLPEGAMTADLQVALRDRWTDLGRPAHPSVVVAGSTYEQVGSKLTNRSRVFGVRETGSDLELVPGATHQKFAPVYPVNDRLREPIAHRRPELTIHVLRNGVKLAVLICRDAYVARAGRLLEDLRVDFVVVPAFSPDTKNFERIAALWATNWGMTTVVAHTRFRGGADAVVGRPSLPRGVWINPSNRSGWISVVDERHAEPVDVPA